MANPPLEKNINDFIEAQLARYRKHIRQRPGSMGRGLAMSTIKSREKGAEDFALFMRNQEPANERTRGAIKRGKTKPLSQLRKSN